MIRPVNLSFISTDGSKNTTIRRVVSDPEYDVASFCRDSVESFIGCDWLKTFCLQGSKKKLSDFNSGRFSIEATLNYGHGPPTILKLVNDNADDTIKATVDVYLTLNSSGENSSTLTLWPKDMILDHLDDCVEKQVVPEIHICCTRGGNLWLKDTDVIMTNSEEPITIVYGNGKVVGRRRRADTTRMNTTQKSETKKRKAQDTAGKLKQKQHKSKDVPSIIGTDHPMRDEVSVMEEVEEESSEKPPQKAESGSEKVREKEQVPDRHLLQWEEKFLQAKKYIEKNKTTVLQGSLQYWITRQRLKYKNTKAGKKSDILTEDQIKKLQSIGIELSPGKGRKPASKTRKVLPNWDERFQQLLDYQIEHGDDFYPDKDSSLGKWVESQRKLFQRKKVSKDHITQLNSIDFPWAQNTSEAEVEEVHEVTQDTEANEESSQIEVVNTKKQLSSSTDTEEKKKVQEVTQDAEAVEENSQIDEANTKKQESSSTEAKKLKQRAVLNQAVEEEQQSLPTEPVDSGAHQETEPSQLREAKDEELKDSTMKEKQIQSNDTNNQTDTITSAAEKNESTPPRDDKTLKSKSDRKKSKKKSKKKKKSRSESKKRKSLLSPDDSIRINI